MNTKEYFERLNRPKPDYTAKYLELIYAIRNKIPNETRHETALRIIQRHENQDNPPGEQSE